MSSSAKAAWKLLPNITSGRAARRLTETDKQAIITSHRACEEARDLSDPDAYYRRNECFHLAIYAASHNGFLIEEATALHRRLSTYRRLQLRVRDRLRTSYSEHSAVVETIIAGEGEVAAELLRSHIIIQGERFADLLA